jgi:hypothetical protein
MWVNRNTNFKLYSYLDHLQLTPSTDMTMIFLVMNV